MCGGIIKRDCCCLKLCKIGAADSTAGSICDFTGRFSVQAANRDDCSKRDVSAVGSQRSRTGSEVDLVHDGQIARIDSELQIIIAGCDTGDGRDCSNGQAVGIAVRQGPVKIGSNHLNVVLKVLQADRAAAGEQDLLTGDQVVRLDCGNRSRRCSLSDLGRVRLDRRGLIAGVQTTEIAIKVRKLRIAVQYQLHVTVGTDVDLSRSTRNSRKIFYPQLNCFICSVVNLVKDPVGTGAIASEDDIVSGGGGINVQRFNP